MDRHKDSVNRGFDVSLVVRVTCSGDGGYIDMIDGSGVVHRIHLTEPGAYAFGRGGGGMVRWYM